MQARSCLHARHGTLAMGLQGERVRSALNVGSGCNEEPSRDDASRWEKCSARWLRFQKDPSLRFPLFNIILESCSAVF